jgi:ketosteroid isomerase-like protein
MLNRLVEVTNKHFKAAVEKNIEKLLDSYSKTEDLLVFVEGPRWATFGYSAVAKGWRDFCSSAISLKNCFWAEGLRAEVHERIGFVAGIVGIEAEINGIPRQIRFRATFVLRKEEDEKWRIIHEHFSQPASDPYGIGDWLKKD